MAGPYYVNPDIGSDSAAGDIDHPFLTIQKGQTSLSGSSGETCYLRGAPHCSGIYTEVIEGSWSMPNGTSLSNTTKLLGYPGETVIIRPSAQRAFQTGTYAGTVQYRTYGSFTVDCVNAVHTFPPIHDSECVGVGGYQLVFTDIEVKNAEANGVLTECYSCRFTRLHSHHNGHWNDASGPCDTVNCGTPNEHGIYIHGQDNIVEYGNFHDNWGFGIQMFNSGSSIESRNIIRYNTVHDNSTGSTTGGSGGILISTGVDNSAYGNIIYNSPGNGLQIDYRCHSCSAYNNTIYNSQLYNIAVGVNDGGLNDVRVKNNILYAGGNGDLYDNGLSTIKTNNLQGTDPLFTSGFHLTSSSPARGTGVAVGVVLDYDSVPFATPPSRGAYEYVDDAPAISDLYYAATAQGSHNGTNAANAFAYDDPTFGLDTAFAQAAGNTLHLCGTITGGSNFRLMTFTHSGSAGSPIMLKWETGAIVEAAYFNALGGVYGTGLSYITVDGGFNGIMRNTANGTALTNHQASIGVELNACSNVIVKNLALSNIYVHTPYSNDPDASDANATQGVNISNCSNALVTNNVIHDAATAIGVGTDSGVTASNLEVSFNAMTNCNRVVVVSSNDTTLTSVLIHDNDFGGGADVWDQLDNAFHHNPIHVFVNNAPGHINGLQIYNNHIHGIWGSDTAYGSPHTTAVFFIENIAAETSPHIYNNVFVAYPSALSYFTNGIVQLREDAFNSVDVFFENNTIIGWNNSAYGMYVLTGTPGAGTPTCTFKNNIIQYIDLFYQVTLTASDYNLYFDTYPTGWGGGNFAAWQGLGNDTHGYSGTNPNLDAAYIPPLTSLAYHAGVDLSGLGITPLNTSKNGIARGSTWTIGANDSDGIDPPPVGVPPLEDFNYTLGAPLAGGEGGMFWTFPWEDLGANPVTVETAPSAGTHTKAAKLDATTYARVTRLFTPVATGIFRWVIRTDNSNPNDAMGLFLNAGGPIDFNNKVVVIFGPSGVLQALDGALNDYVAIGSYASNVWYEIVAEIDAVGHPNQYRISNNGGLTFSGWITANGTMTTVGQIEGYNGADGTTLWLNSIGYSLPLTPPTVFHSGDSMTIRLPGSRKINIIMN